MTNTVIYLIVAGLFLAGVAALQIFLSRGHARWPGLVLPGVSLAYSLLMLLNVVAYPGAPGGTAAVIAMAMVFLLSNVPTAILLAIYFACRGSERRKKELDKMNAQDL